MTDDPQVRVTVAARSTETYQGEGDIPTRTYPTGEVLITQPLMRWPLNDDGGTCPLTDFTKPTKYGPRLPYGTFSVTAKTSEATHGPHGLRQRTETSDVKVEFTGDPTDMVTVTAGEDGWRTEATITGARPGQAPKPTDDQDEN